MKVSKFAMDDLVKIDDLNQYFLNTVVLYKEKPVFVKTISREKSFKMLDLFSQRIIIDKEALKYITPPMRRLGMVNTGGSVVYVQRRPIRLYQMGINKFNLQFLTVGHNYPEGAGVTLHAIQTVNKVEFADMMFDKYPSFEECVKTSKEFDGAMAFDKQFAVDCEGFVWYKQDRVGSVGESLNVESIKWSAGNEHLILLLKGNYEKDSRVVWKTAPKR